MNTGNGTPASGSRSVSHDGGSIGGGAARRQRARASVAEAAERRSFRAGRVLSFVQLSRDEQWS